MLELAVSTSVVVVAFFIVSRSRNFFSLPFFWAAYFMMQYLGFLQLRARYGGYSYLYAAAGFGIFAAGLLIADLIPHLSAMSVNRKRRRGARDGRSQERPSGPAKEPGRTKIDLIFPALPLNIGLFFSLVCALVVTIIFFGQNGVPIFASFPALAWVESTSGVVNRLMTVFGPGSYASLALLAWAVHRETGSRAALVLSYVGLGLAILAQALLASKAAAIMIFIWFNIILFYLDKKRDLRRSLLPLILVVVPVSATIVAVRMMSTQGYWEPTAIYETYYSRLTTTTAEPEDFIFNYSNRFGPMHGEALRREARRIKEQLTGQSKTPIVSEFVYDLMNGISINETGLSATLSVGGIGYVEWGLAGLLLYSFVQGLGFGFIHWHLLRQKTTNIVSLLLWSSVIGYLVSVSISGSILISLEGIVLSVIPPLAMLAPFCAFFLLPMARRYRLARSKEPSIVPQR